MTIRNIVSFHHSIRMVNEQYIHIPNTFIDILIVILVILHYSMDDDNRQVIHIIFKNLHA